MSAFLGKIHYWLYDKIKLHEALVVNIAELANKNGYNSVALINDSYAKYGAPITGSLEDEIEHTNIHGWLQERITSVESRLAYVVTELLKENVVTKDEITYIFSQNGIAAMKEIGINEATPQELFNLIFDFMLEGMPCDRVNDIIENSETAITWETTMDLHKRFWDAVGGDVNNYHDFREAWINGFLSASATGYKYTRAEGGINKISK